MNLIEDLIVGLLKEMGEDPEREGLLKTPRRFRQALEFLTHGYQEDPHKILNGAVFEESYNEMLLVKDIDFFSLCEHHLLPFFGQASVAYIPDGKIIGLSKLARIVDVFGRRLQVQERLTTQIAHCLQQYLEPKGVAVVMRAQHLCMMMRGVEKQNSEAVTSEMLGDFRTSQATRSEFLSLIRK